MDMTQTISITSDVIPSGPGAFLLENDLSDDLSDILSFCLGDKSTQSISFRPENFQPKAPRDPLILKTSPLSFCRFSAALVFSPGINSVFVHGAEPLIPPAF